MLYLLLLAWLPILYISSTMISKYYYYYCICVLFVLLLFAIETNLGKKVKINVAGFFPLKNSSISESKIGRGVMPAVRLALKHINSNANVLPNYKLDIVEADTEVRRRQKQFILSFSLLLFLLWTNQSQFIIHLLLLDW